MAHEAANPGPEDGGAERKARTPQPAAIADAQRRAHGAVRVGLCAMDKKARSKPMTAILRRLEASGDITVSVFGDDCVLNSPIEEWPHVDALIAFFSDGFPLAKASEYAQMTQPFVINSLRWQHSLLDRREVYRTLKEHGLPVPAHAIVNRDEHNRELCEFEEYDEEVYIDGWKVSKPFVEKPVSAENHYVYIYYPHTMGGGAKVLFRKRGDKSAQFYRDINTVRRDGSYIYEGFMPTGGTDVKVYTVGPDYAHAEARKSPTVDGRVMRGPDGKEVRYPVLLTNYEKELARNVCLCFKQTVCGFDLLRCNGKSYVCDVNGWSFVKGSEKYYDDAAKILWEMITSACAPSKLQMQQNNAEVGAIRLNSTNSEATIHDDSIKRSSSSELVAETPCSINRSSSQQHSHHHGHHPSEHDPQGSPMLTPEQHDGALGAAAAAAGKQNSDLTNSSQQQQQSQGELLCVVGVMRHADRTPKQKMKTKVQQRELLDVLERNRGKKGEAKLKTPSQLLDVLQAVSQILERATLAQEDPDPRRRWKPPRYEQNDDAPNQCSNKSKEKTKKKHGVESDEQNEVREEWSEEFLEKLKLVKAVLQRRSREGSHFSGINRKVQLKPLSTDSNTSRPKEALLIVKHGGVLTSAGLRQAEDLGRTFRNVMYPRYGPGGSGLLRLHSTYRHDLKIYSSDEGRVQMSAAAFTKGMLDLEGESLAPVLVSLVTKDHPMLDAFGKGASEDIQRAKSRIHNFMTRGSGEVLSDVNTDSQTSRGRSASSAAKTEAEGHDDNDGVHVTFSGGNVSSSSNEEADFELLSECLQGDPLQLLSSLRELMSRLVRQLRDRCRQQYGEEFDATHTSHSPDGPSREELKRIHKWPLRAAMTSDFPGNDETLRLMLSRWSKLLHDLYQPRKARYDISKVPDIYDMAKYDSLHNCHLELEGLEQMYSIAKMLADAVIPNEYGIDPKAKLAIGSKICSPLLGKVLRDFRYSKQESGVEAAAEDDKGMHHLNAQYTSEVHSKDRHVRTRLYFTSESHIHALVNVLRLAAAEEPPEGEGAPILSPHGKWVLDKTRELDYLSHLVFRMYEKTELPDSDPEKYRVEIHFSPGAVGNPPTDSASLLIDESVSRVLPVHSRTSVHPQEEHPHKEQMDSALTHLSLERTLAGHAVAHFDPNTRTGEKVEPEPKQSPKIATSETPMPVAPVPVSLSQQEQQEQQEQQQQQQHTESDELAAMKSYEVLEQLGNKERQERQDAQGLAHGTPTTAPKPTRRSALSDALRVTPMDMHPTPTTTAKESQPKPKPDKKASSSSSPEQHQQQQQQK
jgi:inositol hexakisphosphate/diphosphoinositol-pentakisphosphate kinase